jgi:hypothetical protein
MEALDRGTFGYALLALQHDVTGLARPCHRQLFRHRQTMWAWHQQQERSVLL